MPFDPVRRKYLAALSAHTGRPTILYASKWSQPDAPDPSLISITEEDMQGFMEVVRGLGRTNLDIVLHSPGGSPTATEAIVDYLRSRFTHIRVFVPQAAMSAATMLACAADEIVMGQHSSLGPIDPQFLIRVNNVPQMVPAQAILDQFEMAQSQCQDPKKLASWMPILNQYGPALLVQCQYALKLSRRLVQDWLKKYMFARLPVNQARSRAKSIAEMLADHTRHFTHSRHLSRQVCRAKGLAITDLENDQTTQDLVLSLFHATTITFTGTPAVKIIENNNRRAFIKIAQPNIQNLPIRFLPPPIPAPVPQPLPQPAPQPAPQPQQNPAPQQAPDGVQRQSGA